MKIMYVEDNPANVLLVKRVAKVGSHEVVSFIDGNEVLAKYESISPDLVLMDVQIAGELNGLDVVRRLRERGIKTPIVAVTAYAMMGDREKCIDAGCDDYMAKPLPVNELVQLFDRYTKKITAELQAVKARETAEQAVIVSAEVPAEEKTPISAPTETLEETKPDTTAKKEDNQPSQTATTSD